MQDFLEKYILFRSWEKNVGQRNVSVWQRCAISLLLYRAVLWYCIVYNKCFFVLLIM